MRRGAGLPNQAACRYRHDRARLLPNVCELCQLVITTPLQRTGYLLFLSFSQNAVEWSASEVYLPAIFTLYDTTNATSALSCCKTSCDQARPTVCLSKYHPTSYQTTTSKFRDILLQLQAVNFDGSAGPCSSVSNSLIVLCFKPYVQKTLQDSSRQAEQTPSAILIVNKVRTKPVVDAINALLS